ncbi:FliG C-terminal domain-containing protein [Thiomicrorhabdus aquaedulcis]|uniref:FliG C-terminal domain-containing protein n=1 Tax=Thiomicrorhabdus aquaedulcis TaxID=2211106 RepID=UPI000FD890FA|nr:FliG C-terminal domain-containing protein [Thiomicrorhabdus aquaedulcis]
MEILARRDASGEFQIELGPVVFTLPVEVVKALQQVIEQRINQPSEVDAENLKRKLEAYRTLATKMASVDDRVVQKFATKVTPEQLVTIVRLAQGDVLYNKVLRNLSQQNRRQFEEDYAQLNKITEQHACLYMEQLVPTIKRAAQEQKQYHASMG